jgi:alanyl-tRNA synthetase
MNDFKSYATRRMIEKGLVSQGANVWSRHGSTRYLWDEESVAAAGRYVMEQQGPDLSGDPPGTIEHAPQPLPHDRPGHDRIPDRGSENAPLPYGRGSERGRRESTIDNRPWMIDVSYRVIADHIRTLTFAITDGATPSNEGRGYVLRRILRRAVRYGRQYLDMHEPFLCDLVRPLVDHMGEVFPELHKAHGGKNVQHVTDILRDEEASFLKTLDRGMRLFDEAAEYAQTHHHGRISGEAAFKLHDTYGFPIDLTEQMAEERDLTVDIGEYERLMECARTTARGTKELSEHVYSKVLGDVRGTTEFDGYEHLLIETTINTLLNRELAETSNLPQGGEGFLLLARTPFYAEKGGQVGDTGQIMGRNGNWEFAVEDTRWHGESILHKGHCVQGTVKVVLPSAANKGGPAMEPCTALVDESHRRPSMQNHTATHILNLALREVLGEHVQQKGSLVDPEKTRFDFSHPKQLLPEELIQIERLVNEQIRRGYEVYDKVDGIREVDQKKAREINTLRAVFGEKYPEKVRVVSIGAEIKAMLADPKNPKWMRYSVEFCGGTHLKNSKEAEEFLLVSEEAVAKGIRRVVGVTANAARMARGRGDELLERAEAIRKGIQLKTPPPGRGGIEGAGASHAGHYDLGGLLRDLAEAVIPIQTRHRLADQIAVLQEFSKEQEKQAARAAGRGALEAVAEALETRAQDVNGVTVLVAEIPSAHADALRTGIDYVRNKKGSSAVLLATVEGEKVTLVAGMSKDVVEKGIKAGDLIKEIAPLVGGKGGGRPDLAQGGGTDASRLGMALERATEWLHQRFAQ